MNYPLVSICIPTYNRADILRNSLETLLCQPEFLSKKVEIVISDNASTDETKSICENLACKYNNFKYFRNKENINDRNFPMALSRGTGLLRKLFNDSFNYTEDALKYICDAVEKYGNEKPILYFSNTNGTDTFLENIEISEFLKNISYFITWIGSFACWDTDCENINTEDISYCSKNLWQVKKLLSLFEKNNSRAVILNGRILYNQEISKKNVSYGLFRVFHDNYLSILDEYVKKGLLSKDTFDWLEKDLLMNYYVQWIVAIKFHKEDFIFSRKENLARSIRKAYKKKPYYLEFRSKCEENINKLKKPRITFKEILDIVRLNVKNFIKKVIFYNKIKKYIPWKNKK